MAGTPKAESLFLPPPLSPHPLKNTLRAGTLRLGGAKHFFHIFGNHVHLYINNGTWGVVLHDGALPCVRGNPKLEFCGVCMDGGDGEGDAVYADAAFIYGVAQVLCRDADAYHVVLPDGGDSGDGAGGVDMPHNKVTAEATLCAHSTLQVAGRAGVEGSQRGNAHGLAEEVELYGGAANAIHCEAAAVNGHGVAQGKLCGKGDVDGVACSLFYGGTRYNAAGTFYDSGEHAGGDVFRRAGGWFRASPGWLRAAGLFLAGAPGLRVSVRFLAGRCR